MNNESGTVKINWIEYFKIIQRIVMVILTLLMLWAMRFVGTEIAIMRAELTEANIKIGGLVSEINEHGGQVSDALNKLEQRLGKSWFF